MFPRLLDVQKLVYIVFHQSEKYLLTSLIFVCVDSIQDLHLNLDDLSPWEIMIIVVGSPWNHN